MTTQTEEILRQTQNSMQTVSEDERTREIRELREKIEQAVVCVNTALYVLLKNIERAH